MADNLQRRDLSRLCSASKDAIYRVSRFVPTRCYVKTRLSVNIVSVDAINRVSTGIKTLTYRLPQLHFVALGIQNMYEFSVIIGFHLVENGYSFIL
jgi:hypothetical protein